MSDSEFDALRDELASLDFGLAEVAESIDSVAGGVEGGDVAHAAPLLFLDKKEVVVVATGDEIAEFRPEDRYRLPGIPTMLWVWKARLSQPPRTGQTPDPPKRRRRSDGW